MSFGHGDLTAAMRRMAEKRIEDAIAEGKFDNLPGAGQPMQLDPLPADEEARAAWWAIKILRNNDVTPDEVRYRKMIDALKGQLHAADTEERVRQLARQINDLVRRLNTLGTNALSAPVDGVDEARAVEAWRARR